MSYYEENEIMSSEFIDLFIKEESKQLIELINKKEINCIFGEKKVFIYLQASKYHYLDIGHLENCIFTSDLLIYFYNKPDLKGFISKIKEESFDKFIQPHLENIQKKSISYIKNKEGNDYGKILKIKELSGDFYNLNKLQSFDRVNSYQEMKTNAKKILKLILFSQVIY